MDLLIFFGCIYFLPWIDHGELEISWLRTGLHVEVLLSPFPVCLLYKYFIQWPPRYPHLSQTRQQIAQAIDSTTVIAITDHDHARGQL